MSSPAPGLGRATLMVGWVWARQGTSCGEGLRADARGAAACYMAVLGA